MNRYQQKHKMEGPWEEQMSIVMARRGINWREERIVVQDRSRWRRICRSLDTAR
jgi:hypothetical protein